VAGQEQSTRLHSVIESKWISQSFKPMLHLVALLSNEAANDRPTPSDCGDGGGGVRVQTLGGNVTTLQGAGPTWTVAEVKSAIFSQLGTPVSDQRLYVDGPPSTAGVVGISRLELLRDGDSIIGDCGLFNLSGRVLLRSRGYEALRQQLEYSTNIVDTLLEAHYDSFHSSVQSIQKMEAQFDTLDGLTQSARGLVGDCRSSLGCRARENGAKQGDEIAALWERKVEADEALVLLARLRLRALAPEAEGQPDAPLER